MKTGVCTGKVGPGSEETTMAGEICDYSSADLETFQLDANTGQLQYTHRGHESAADVERKMLKVIHKMIAGFQRRKSKTLVDRRSTSTVR